MLDTGFDGARMISTLAGERITGCTAVPAIYYYILNHPAFRPADVAGRAVGELRRRPDRARAGPPDHGAVPRTPGSRNGFGLTESTSIATLLPHEWAAGHADSVGFAAPHTDVAISPDGAADGAEPGTGEILIRGQSICAGYWNKPEATAADVRRPLAAHRRHRPGRTPTAWSTCWTGSRT